nr:serine hydrolase domain-containing protein [Psychrobacillus sp.]
MFINKVVIFLLMLIIPIHLSYVPLAVQAAESFDTTKVDEYVTNYIDKNGLPGAAIVVIKDGNVLYEKGFGHDSDGNPLTEKSIIGIASGAKPFTAFAVLQLVDDGKIKLDDLL